MNGKKKIADVIDPTTEDYIVKDPLEQGVLKGMQEHGPHLGGRPDLDIQPWLNRDKAATGRVIEPRTPGSMRHIDLDKPFRHRDI